MGSDAGTCYKYVTTTETADIAQAACVADGANLVRRGQQMCVCVLVGRGRVTTLFRCKSGWVSTTDADVDTG